jgi:hypothetical protein
MAGRVWIFKDTCWQSVDESNTSDIAPHTCNLTSLGAYMNLLIYMFDIAPRPVSKRKQVFMNIYTIW